MFRRSSHTMLKARPKTALTEVGSNRKLEEPWHGKFGELFDVPPFAHKQVLHNWRYFMLPGKAATGPPVGQDFSSVGLKAMDFAKSYNDKTKGKFKDDVILQVRIQVYYDKSYRVKIEPPPIAWYLLRSVRKKRRDTGNPTAKGRYTAFMTMEMCYEIAKQRGLWINDWRGNPMWPPLEFRARDVCRRAQNMGIAVMGVNAPDSPVKGVSPSAYEKQSKIYREEQWKQWEAYCEEEHKTQAPLVHKFHNPDMHQLPSSVLAKALKDPNSMKSLYYASHPNSDSFVDAGEKERLNSVISTLFSQSSAVGTKTPGVGSRPSKWQNSGNAVLASMGKGELEALLYNWRMPSTSANKEGESYSEPQSADWEDVEKYHRGT